MDADGGIGNLAPARERTGLSVRPGQSFAAGKLIDFFKMNANDYLSEDGLVILLLCSMLGLDEKTSPGLGRDPFL